MSVRSMTISALLLLASVGCWKDDMADDAHAKPLEKNTFFADGKMARPLINGTVPRGGKMIQDPLYAVTAPDPAMTNAGFPQPVTEASLKRGQERYDIYCAACHGGLGDGNGMIVQRGFPKPPSFYEQRLRDAKPGHFFNVITHGYGAMYSYNDRITPADRWNIVGYVKALQLSTERVDPPSVFKATTQPGTAK